MTTALVSPLPSILIALLGLPVDDARALPALASESGDAWVVVHAGSPWVCWSPGEPGCWRRIELELAPAGTREAFVPEEEREPILLEPTLLAPRTGEPTLDVDVRFGFEPGRLWIAIEDEGVWIVEPEQRQARWLDTPAAAVTLARPALPECGPLGHVPGLVSGQLGWIVADRCAGARVPSGCLRPRPRVRKPSGVRIAASLGFARVEGWSLEPAAPELGLPAHLRRQAGFELAFVLTLGFEGLAAQRLARARDELLARDRRRLVPRVDHDEHPLAAAEQAALRTIACTEVA